jgi:hypothetical protein
MVRRIEDLQSIYHLTSIRNLPSIIHDGLLSRVSLQEKQIAYTDIANEDILSKRTKKGLDQCVPFHFHTHTEFDVAVQKQRRLEGPYIYLAVNRSVARDKKFKIILRHPISSGSEIKILEYDEGFSQIDWDVMNTPKGNPPNPNYDGHVRMAECISPYCDVPFEDIYTIFVPNEDVKNQVELLVKNYSTQVRVVSSLFTK